MKAMVLAAGMGTRLRPLTNDRPKALVEVGGRTMLEITLARLRAFGIFDVIINAHHFAGMIVEYLAANKYFGMRLEVSREEVLLDTGGGLKKAAHFFLADSGGAGEPFILHNVDIVSSIDLRRMAKFHLEHEALATLAVQDRKTSRYLLFDEGMELCGRRSRGAGDEIARDSRQAAPLAFAFAGIHVISPRVFPMMSEEGVFSIIMTYLRLATQGEKIMGFRADEYYWRDLGTPENVRLGAEDIKQKALL